MDPIHPSCSVAEFLSSALLSLVEAVLEWQALTLTLPAKCHQTLSLPSQLRDCSYLELAICLNVCNTTFCNPWQTPALVRTRDWFCVGKVSVCDPPGLLEAILQAYGGL